LGRVTELLKPPDSLRGGGEPVPTRSGLKLPERAPGYIDTKLDDPELNPDTVVAVEQRVAPEPADAELVVHGSCRLFHGASVAAERVREHRTDRLKGCRSKTADNWVPASGGRSAASNPVGGADLTDPRRGRRLINSACLILLPTDATVPFLLDFDEAQSIGYIEYPTGVIYTRIKIRSERILCLKDRLCAATLWKSDSADAIVARVEISKTSSED
jgi:hypothetical protein